MRDIRTVAQVQARVGDIDVLGVLVATHVTIAEEDEMMMQQARMRKSSTRTLTEILHAHLSAP